MKSLPVLIAKDLRRRLADPAGLLLNLSIPLVMAGLLALAFGGSGKDDNVQVLRLLVVNHDDGPVGRALAGATQNPEAAGRLEIKQVKDRDEGLRRLREEESAALVVIPQDFSKDVLEGRRVTLEILKNPAQSIMPVVAQQGAEVAALYMSGGARLLQGQGRRIEDLFDGRGWADAAAVAALVSDVYTRLRRVDGLLVPPVVEVEETKETAEKGKGGLDFMSWMYPGMMMMGLLFAALGQMRDLMKEGTSGTLRRQLTAPIGASTLLVAKIVTVAAVSAISFVLLAALGRWAFRMRWGDPLALALTGAAAVLATTGFAALLYAVVRTERQGDTFGTIAVMLMSILGGTMFPPQAMPAWMGGLSRMTISFWGNAALRGATAAADPGDAPGALPVLLALGMSLTIAGALLLRRRHMKGAL